MQSSQQLQQQVATAPAASPVDHAEEEAGADGSGSMPEEVFKWMAHSVNQEFLGMGYPAILTKSGDQEFVNLCPLIRNCSSVLTLLKARRRAPAGGDSEQLLGKGGGAFGDVKCDENATSTAPTAPTGTSNARRKRRRWGGLFSSKQHHRRHHQQSATKDNLYEDMARKMRKDTERIIRRTACLDSQASQGTCPPSPYPAGSQEHQDFAFMHLTWRSFRKQAQARILECSEAVRRSEELQQEVVSLAGQLERLRESERALVAAAAAAGVVEDATSLTSASAVGRLQRVGGFLRRAVSKERLTFGRRPKAGDGASDGVIESDSTAKRSRSCSVHILPSPQQQLLTMAGAAGDPETELRRIRLEFERRERLLLSERDKLRQINSKLNFRVQHLSSMAAVAKQTGSNIGGSSGGSGPGGSGTSGSGGVGSCARGASASGKDIDYQQRRLERRTAALQKEVASLKQELNEKIDSLTGIGAVIAKFSKAAAAAAAEDGSTPAEQSEQLELGQEIPTDVAHVPRLVDTVCHATMSRLNRLRQAKLDAQSRVAGLCDSLQLVQRRLGLTRAAMENARAMEVELEAIAARMATVAVGGGRSLSVSAAVRRCSFNTGSRAPARPTPPTVVAATTATASVESTATDTASASAGAHGDQQKLELRDRIIGKLTAMLRERQEEVRRLKEISLSCQDISGGRAGGGGCQLQQLQPHPTSSSERKSRASDFRPSAFR